MPKKTGLGKGLDALFGPTPEEEKVKVDANNKNGDNKSNSKGAIPNLEPIE